MKNDSPPKLGLRYLGTGAKISGAPLEKAVIRIIPRMLIVFSQAGDVGIRRLHDVPG